MEFLHPKLNMMGDVLCLKAFLLMLGSTSEAKSPTETKRQKVGCRRLRPSGRSNDIGLRRVGPEIRVDGFAIIPSDPSFYRHAKTGCRSGFAGPSSA